MTKTKQTQLLELLDTYCGWDIQERNAGYWVAVDRYDGHVIADTWARSLEECKELTLQAAAKCAGVVVEGLVAQCRIA